MSKNRVGQRELLNYDLTPSETAASTDMPNKDYARIETTIRYLAKNFHRQPDLKQMAAGVHLSAYHFQRLFRRWAGITPKQFLQYLTADYARDLLRDARSVLDVSSAAGLSSGSRLHDLCVTLHAMTPGEMKAVGRGLTIRYGVHATPFGACLIAVTDRGICALQFIDVAPNAGAVAALRRQWPEANLVAAPRTTRAVADRLFRAPDNRDRAAFPLHVQGTNFQIKIWEALLRIPFGAAASYEDIARLAGVPNAARAAGSAIGQNPVALLIPCHRVIRKTGAVGDYRWGCERKQAMLAWEAAQLDRRPARA